MKVIVGKVVVLGAQGVGKTSTITRYVENTFSPNVTPTIGASFFTCKVQIEDIMVKMQIWDTAGQERFKAMAPMFYRNANAALLVYDITSYDSFKSMKGWVQELKRNVEEPMVLCVIGNKIDLASQRQVSKEEAMQYSNSIGASYHECSALNDLGVGIVFEEITKGLIRLSGENIGTLKVYDDINYMVASPTDLDPTDTAKEETVNTSIDSIALGKSVKSRCC